MAATRHPADRTGRIISVRRARHRVAVTRSHTTDTHRKTEAIKRPTLRPTTALAIVTSVAIRDSSRETTDRRRTTAKAILRVDHRHGTAAGGKAINGNRRTVALILGVTTRHSLPIGVSNLPADKPSAVLG